MAARQQTLRAAIEWSHDLLVPEEQRLFARLAVFRGGCTLEAAEEVADADLDLLQSLVDKSLLRHTSERFQMLETIHEYARERLADSDEATAIRDRHGAFFVALAERAYEGRSSSAERWFQVMDDEVDNFRAVLDWARDTSPGTEAQLAGALGYYWSLRGSVREARDRFEGALGRHSLRDRTRARALTFYAAAMGMDTASVAPLEEAFSIFREHGDPLGEAMARERLAYKYIAFGEEDAARHAFEKSLALREAAGADEAESWYALGGLCQLLVAAGDAAQAEPLARELYRVGKLHGRLDTQGDALHYLVDCALIPGDYVETERRYRRSLAHAWRCGIWGQAVEELRGFAMSLGGQGDASRAVMLAALATAHREALERGPLSPSHWWGRLQERLIGSARAALAPDVGEEAECTGSKADFDAVVEELIGAKAS
jgi:tetratricopeptide (TPR) repeat protein